MLAQTLIAVGCLQIKKVRRIMMNEEKTKLLNLMRYWLFGTFVIVFAAITAYITLYTGREFLGEALRAGMPIWGITGIACLIFYFGYRYYLQRRP
jgi:hypothetical protein